MAISTYYNKPATDSLLGGYHASWQDVAATFTLPPVDGIKKYKATAAIALTAPHAAACPGGYLVYASSGDVTFTPQGTQTTNGQTGAFTISSGRTTLIKSNEVDGWTVPDFTIP